MKSCRINAGLFWEPPESRGRPFPTPSRYAQCFWCPKGKHLGSFQLLLKLGLRASRVRSLKDGVLATGDREVLVEEAAIVQRIFRDYASGMSPKAIARRLNAEHIKGPGQAAWNPSTIHGSISRGTGILNNELYVGRIV